ncbi:MAG: hypothetical protein J0I34_15225 [Pseudonocardia sp.]|uniref:hypothetical protein n=1 Tax=unclassified Pseudonocardia TaxID=2619320 RepID=UPI000ADB4D03|nr:hypothetical protein [Pseudonocardia sp.]
MVNHDSGDGWVVENSAIRNDKGAGLVAGARQQVLNSCLRNNGQYGMNAYKAGDSITGLVVTGNEILSRSTSASPAATRRSRRVPRRSRCRATSSSTTGRA